MNNELIDPKDIVSFDIPLFIRLLEFCREEVKDDAALHVLVENVISIGKELGVPLTMDNYEDLISSVEVTDSAMESFLEYLNKSK